MLNLETKAKKQAAEVLRINPKFSLEKWAATINNKNQMERDRTIEGLRRAGLK